MVNMTGEGAKILASGTGWRIRKWSNGAISLRFYCKKCHHPINYSSHRLEWQHIAEQPVTTVAQGKARRDCYICDCDDAVPPDSEEREEAYKVFRTLKMVK